MAISLAWHPKNEIGFTTSGTEVISTLNMTVLLAKSNVPMCLVVSQRLYYQNVSLHMYIKHSIIAQKDPLHN